LQEVKEVAGASYRVNWKIYCVSLPPLISLKEASKARVAAYKKAIEDAVKATAAAEDAATAAAAAAAEDTPAEPSELIELNSDDKNDSADDTYTTFEDINDIKAIGVEDKGDFVLG
jgi:hypothetical protein